MTSILWFNDVQFPWSWSTTILLTAILKWFGLLKSDYKSVHLKLCASSIIRILFLHYACHICRRFSFKIQFTISAAFCFDVVILKNSPAWWRHKWHKDVNIFPYFLWIRNLCYFSFPWYMALDDCISAEKFIQLQNSIRYFGSPCMMPFGSKLTPSRGSHFGT